KVAVLDASLGAGVHPNASAIVADTINEQFVKSADFIAIDRAYISSIQEEKKLQLSGDVDSDDIKELGATFGAKYLCIANVSQLGSTFTVSARLIEVETAQVVVQESARRQGQIDVLFNIAEEVGAKLIGKEIVSNEQVQPVRQATPTKPAPTQPAKTSNQVKAFSRITVSYMMPTYNGSGRDWLDDVLWDYETWTYGFDIHTLIPFKQYLYYAISGSMGWEDVHDWVIGEDTNSTINVDLRATIGGILPIGSIMQFYGGLGIGFQYLERSSDFWLINNESEAGALVYGIELGSDFRLSSLVFSMRFQTGMSTFPEYTVFNDSEKDFGYTAFMIGVGFVF
ncbi:MAG: hypothetical protein KAH95_00795, partial [Spirochaetales bacterium]|nr:hypothetical protein [Spirochaetales bacterium]